MVGAVEGRNAVSLRGRKGGRFLPAKSADEEGNQGWDGGLSIMTAHETDPKAFPSSTEIVAKS